MSDNSLSFYLKREHENPKHQEKGEYRRFSKTAETKIFILPDGKEQKVSYSSGSIEGSDIFCGHCQHWNTMKDKSILFGIIGECKNCGTPWIK